MRSDTIETPHGNAVDCLGGSSTYFSLAARLFTKVRLVSVVGTDFPPQHRQLLESRGVDLAGVETKPGKTFRWHGRYATDMNSRQTLDVQLNTFGDFRPKVPAEFRDTPFVFLANGSPATQASVLEQMPGGPVLRRRHDGPVDRARAQGPARTAAAARRG